MLDATHVQISKVPAGAPSSTATTPEHLWDTSSVSLHSISSPLLSKSSVCSPSDPLGLSAAGPSATTLSPWSLATTPEHLWDTSCRTPTSMRSSSTAPHAMRSRPTETQKELSLVAFSPHTSRIAAAVTSTPSTFSAPRLRGITAGPAAESSTLTGQADASAGHQSTSLQHSLGPYCPKFSGSPVAGLCRIGPQFAVRLTKKQKVRWLQISERCLLA